MTLTLPSHTLKFGAEFLNSQLPVLKEPDGANGRYDFDDLTAFWAGTPFAFDTSLPAGATVLGLTNLADPQFNLRQSQFGFFVQDNWKVLPTLTLNLGLRYEFQTELGEENDHLSSFRDYFGDQITVGGPFFKNPTLKNFSPRIGFAWSPSAGTALRGGIGMYYVPTGVVEYQYVMGQLAPFLGEGGLTDSIVDIDFPNAFFTQAAALGGAPNYRQLEFDQSPSRMYRWSLTLERELGNWFISAGYSGSRGEHLPITGEANLNKWAGWPNNVPTADKQYIDGELINPLMNRLTVTWMQGNSFYHGGTFNVMRRLSNGLQFQAAYTLSKATDQSVTTGNRTEGFGQAQRTNLMWDMDHWKGRSSFDMRNNLVMNLTYDLPQMSSGGIGAAILNGWSANTIVSLSDGPPFTLFDQNNTPQRLAMERRDQIRPNLIPGGNNDLVDPGNPDVYYDVSQFVPSVCRGVSEICQKGDPGYAVGYFGNLGFNTLSGPGIATVDFSINKAFQLSETNRLQIRAEFFNLFNRPNFGTPNDAPFLQSGSGNNLRVNPSVAPVDPTVVPHQIDDTRTSARQIQFGLRYTF
jgi:outer membrane receptor protein involved in Fe transport